MQSSQHGQALPLGLAMILIGTLGALVLYNTGRTAVDKARLANAADAAAYSGMLWQARALNFQAYTNRAMVANQVSIAQAVSLRSWSDYARQTAGNIRNVLGALPFVGPLVQGIKAAADAVDAVVHPVTQAMVLVVDKVTLGLSLSQRAMFASAFAATPEIVDDVITKSDPRFESLTAYSLGGLYSNLSDWRDFTERRRPDPNAEGERSDLVMDSRDAFSARRDWKFFSEFWFYSTPLTRHRVFRSGTTRLIGTGRAGDARWEWKAKDNIALQNRRLRWTGKEKKIEAPIGWGEAYASEGSDVHRALCRRQRFHPDCRNWTANGVSERFGAASPSRLRGYAGLRDFRTIGADMLARDDKDPKLRLRIEAAMPAAEAHSSADTVDGAVFGLDVGAAGARLSSISIAEVYYRRPDEATAGGEKTTRQSANGYNPYWDVRLAPVPDRERLLAVGLRMGTAALGGGGTGGVVPQAGGSLGSGLTPGAGSSTALPHYVTTLASAGSDRDVATLDDEIRRITAVTPGSLARLVVDGDPATLVRERLEQVLESAKGEILAGLADGVLDGARGVLGAIDIEGAERMVAEARAVSERLERVASAVARDMGDQLETLVETAVTTRVPDVARISELARALESATGAAAEDTKAELERLVALRDAVLSELREQMVARLYSVVERHVPPSEWRMPPDIAYETVDLILEEYRGQLGTDGLDGVLRVVVDDAEHDPAAEER